MTQRDETQQRFDRLLDQRADIDLGQKLTMLEENGGSSKNADGRKRRHNMRRIKHARTAPHFQCQHETIAWRKFSAIGQRNSHA